MLAQGKALYIPAIVIVITVPSETPSSLVYESSNWTRNLAMLFNM